MSYLDLSRILPRFIVFAASGGPPSYSHLINIWITADALQRARAPLPYPLTFLIVAHREIAVSDGAHSAFVMKKSGVVCGLQCTFCGTLIFNYVETNE